MVNTLWSSKNSWRLPYDGLWEFSAWYAVVKHKWVYNRIDKNGKLISEVWYDRVGEFHEWYAWFLEGVWSGWDHYNFIDTNWKKLLEDCYTSVDDFREWYAPVQMEGSDYSTIANRIDIHGKLLSDMWYDFTLWFVWWYAKARQWEKWNLVDMHWKLIGDVWYDDIWNFSEWYAPVKREWQWVNFINAEGKYLF